MPVYKDDKGKYYVKFRSKDPVTGKLNQVTKRGFNTKREASKWETENKYAVQTSTSATFWDLFQISLDNNDTSRTTRKKKEAWIKMYFKDFKDMPIDQIEKPALVEWRNNLKTEGISTRTMNNGLQYVRAVFTFYSDVYGGINNGNVLKSYRMPKNEKREMQVWSIEEFNRFAEYVKNPVYRAYYTYLFWTGCRRGEAKALCGKDIRGNKVRIYRSMKHEIDGFTDLKTDSSERTITIDDELKKLLLPLIAEANPFVFGGDHSLPTSKIDKVFRQAILDSGVKRIRLHDLRHSHASILLNNGVNIVAVSKRLGHATVSQTLDTYTHLMQETDEKMMETITALHKPKDKKSD